MKQILVIILILIAAKSYSQEFENLAIGEKAKDFTLNTIQGDEVDLNKIKGNKSVVLVVLRGWVGSQCPVCSRQLGSFIAEAEKLNELGASVVFIYPGPSAELQEKAKAFSKDFEMPDNFYFALDPDYSMINKYGLRWDAPKETAYPSTFIIDKNSKIVFSKISKTHGGRAKIDEVLAELEKR